MKKIADVILISIYIFALFLLAIFMFWGAYGKEYVEKYIDNEYGQYIIRTSDDLDLYLEGEKNKQHDTRESTQTGN